MQAVEREMARAERAELREPGSDRFFPDSAALARARSQIEAHLQAKPDDAAALVLLGRVGRFVLRRSRSAECSPEHGCVLDSTFDDGPFQAALDRALILRADDPEAHFWKARLLDDGRPVLRDGEFAVDIDTEQVLVHARRAVVLDSRNVRYREFLAVSLADMGRYVEAVDAIRPVSDKHPLYLIFQDFAAVPIPEGAVPWPHHAAFAAVGMDDNPPRFAAQTGRSWAVALSIDQLEAFYRRRWPEFRLFAVTSAEEQEGDSTTGWFQNFRADRNGKLQPARDSGFIARLERGNDFDDLLMAVRQFRRHDEGAPERYPAAMGGKEAFLEVILVTGRKGPRS